MQSGEFPLLTYPRRAGNKLADANAKLGKSQRLSAVELREELPRSSIGKILKKELRAPFWAAVSA